MYLQIKKANFKKNDFGQNDIIISMIGLYQDDGKRIKRIKLDKDKLLEIIKDQKIIIPLTPNQ